jgi:hypothetical protein
LACVSVGFVPLRIIETLSPVSICTIRLLLLLLTTICWNLVITVPHPLWGAFEKKYLNVLIWTYFIIIGKKKQDTILFPVQVACLRTPKITRKNQDQVTIDIYVREFQNVFQCNHTVLYFATHSHTEHVNVLLPFFTRRKRCAPLRMCLCLPY